MGNRKFSLPEKHGKLSLLEENGQCKFRLLEKPGVKHGKLSLPEEHGQWKVKLT